MTNILGRIIARKRSDLATSKRDRSIDTLERAAADLSPPRGFRVRLAEALARGGFGLIAEIKKASPSHGLIRPGFHPAALARSYAAAGASCLSVLTDAPFFSGDVADLAAARAACPLPILRKDFIIDPWQVAETRAIGGDCILLIMAVLEDGLALELEAAAAAYGLDVLIEAHDRQELDRALRLQSPLIGINNRNLDTLVTDLATTEQLARHVPRDRMPVSESGLGTRPDLERMAACGARCFLIGEALLRQPDVEAATRRLLAAAA